MVGEGNPKGNRGHNLLAQQSTIDEKDHAIITVDIRVADCFPSIHKQPLFDLLAGVASKDYPGTRIHKGGTLYSPAALLTCLPLALLLYSQPIQLEHCYTRRLERAGELVTVDDGVSNGSPEGTPFAITAIPSHGFVNEALIDHPDPAIKVYGIADDLTIMGPMKVITPFSGQWRYFEVCSACGG